MENQVPVTPEPTVTPNPKNRYSRTFLNSTPFVKTAGLDNSGNIVDFGDSKYDTKSTDISQLQQGNLNELRAQRQSGLDKAANAVPRFVGRVATSAAELAGNVYGLGKFSLDLQMEPSTKAAYLLTHGNLEGYKGATWTTIFDNEVTRGLDSLDASIKSIAPEYESKDYQNAAWYNKWKYANFYASDLVDAAAFATGSALSGGAASKAISPIFKLAMTGDIAKVTAAMKDVTDGKITYDLALKSISKEAAKIKAADYGQKFIETVIAGTAESGQEARGIGTDFVNNMTKELTTDKVTGLKTRDLTPAEKDKIESLKENAEGLGFFLNMLVTGPTNMAIQSSFFKKLKGLKEDKALVQEAEGLSKPNLDYDVTKGAYTPKVKTKVGSFLSNTGKVLKNNSEEAIQEMYQTGVQHGTTDYYQAKFHGKEGLDQMLKSVLVGFQASLSDEGLLSGLLGFLTPGVSNTLLTGGKNIKESLGRFSEQQRTDLAYAAVLTKLKTSDVFKSAYDAAAKHQVFQNQLDNAIENSDDFESKNQMHNIMTNLVLSRIKAGRIDDLKSDINYYKTLSKEDFKEAFGVELNEQDRDHVVSFMQDKLDKVNDVIKTKADINSVFGTLSQGNQERLIHATLAAKDSKKRASDLSKEVIELIKNDYSTSNQTYHNAAFGLLHEDYNTLSDEQKIAYRDMITKSDINPLDKDKIFTSLNDIEKLKGRGDNYVKLYNELVDPKNQVSKDEEDTDLEGETEVGSEADNLDKIAQRIINKDKTLSDDPEATAFYEANKDAIDKIVKEHLSNINDQSSIDEEEEPGNTEEDQIAAENSNLGGGIVIPAAATTIDNSPANVVLTQGKPWTQPLHKKIIGIIKKFMGKHEDINKHIILKAVNEHGHTNVHILMDGVHIGNVNGLNDKFYNSALNASIIEQVSKSDKEFTPEELGIYFGLSDGSLEYVAEGEELTPVDKLKIDYSLTGGQMMVFDIGVNNSDTEGRWVNNLTDKSLFKPGVVINESAIPRTLGRFVLVIPMPNGAIKYVRVRPDKLDSIKEEGANKLYGKLIAKVAEYKKEGHTLTKDDIYSFNTEFNNEFFIALGAKDKTGKSKKLKYPYKGKLTAFDGYQMNIGVDPTYPGKIRVELRGRLGEEHIPLEFFSIAITTYTGSMNGFLLELNKRFKGNITITKNDFKVSINQNNYKTNMVASVTPDIIKNQNLLFRKGNPENTPVIQELKPKAKKKTKIVEPPIEDTKETKTLDQKIEDIKNNSKIIKLTPDEKNYVNSVTGKIYQRVTTFINGSNTKKSTLLDSASAIGNKFDILVRDFFDGGLKPLTQYDAAPQKELKAFVLQLQKLKAEMDSRGETVLANNILLYNDELGIAGTVDLLTYDKDGNFRIYDMKTMRGNQVTDLHASGDNKGKSKYAHGYKTSDDSNKVKHQKQLSLYRILLYNTHGILAQNLSIIPIKVGYEVGDKSSKVSDLLPLIPVLPLNKVKTASLNTALPITAAKQDEQKSLLDQIADLDAKILATGSKDIEAKMKLKKERETLMAQLPPSAYKISDDKGTPLQQSEINEIIQMLPKFIRIEDISKILNNLRTNGIPLGLFKDKVIYLNKISATKGVAYHEAFHAVFRTVLNDSEINRYLSEAKKEYTSRNSSATLKADIDRLRLYSPEYAILSNKELEELVYEEYLADKFAEFKINESSQSPFRRLFIILKALKDLFHYHSEELQSLFTSISNKTYVNSEIADNRFTKLKVGLPVYSLIPAGTEVVINEETGKPEAHKVNHTQKKSEKMIATFAAKIDNDLRTVLSDEEKLNDAIKELFDIHVAQRETAIYNALKQDTSLDQVLAEKELETYANENSREVLFDAVKKRLKTFKYSYLDQSPEDDEVTTDDVIEDNDGAIDGEKAKFGSKDSWLSGGNDNLPALIKKYISFATYMEFDDVLGEETEVAVDSQTAFNGLTRILADTPREEMMNKLLTSSKYNPNLKAVLDRLMADTNMVINEDDNTVSQPTKNFNDYQMFLNAFDNSLTKQIFTLADDNNNFQVQPANKNDAKVITTAIWSANIGYLISNLMYSGLTIKQSNDLLSKEYTRIQPVFNKSISKPISNKDLQEKVESLFGILNKTGISLSRGYIEYTILKTMKDNDVKLNASQSKIVSLNETILPFDIDLFIGGNGFKGIGAMVANGEDLFSREKGKGAYERLATIAEANGLFDESLGNASFKNAENKDVYELIKSSYVLQETRKLKDDSYLKSLEDGEQTSNDLDNKNNKFISNNYLLKNFKSIIKDLKIGIIDGLRKESKDRSGDGVVFGKYDGRTYLIQGLAYFASRKKQDSKSIVKYIFRQNEASNTAFIADLPVQKLFDGKKPNFKIISPLYDNFKKEFDRITRETNSFGKKGQKVYKGYNNTEDGRAFDFTEFKYIKDINPELYETLLVLAKSGNVTDIPVNAVKVAISKYLEEGIKKYKANLVKYGIIDVSSDTGEVTRSNYMPINLAVDKENSIEGDENKALYSSFDEAIAEFYLNDYLMSNSLNELFDGDYAISRKDKKDISKRNRGAMGSGNNYGSGKHRVAYTKDIIKYVIVKPENGNLTRVSIGENITKRDGKLYITRNGIDIEVSKINTNDAQSFQSFTHKIFASHALGKLDDKVLYIYKKLMRMQSISDKEQTYLEKMKASLNPDKTVTFGRGIYHKTSEHTLIREMISYIPEANKIKFKDLNEQLIQLIEDRDFDKDKITNLTKQISKLYKAQPGFDYHHKLANQMDIHGIDQVVTESASKGATLMPVDSEASDMDLSQSMTDVNNEYKRLQTETPTGSDSITDGSQIIQLIDSEQDDSAEFKMPDGTVKSLGTIRTEYRQLMSKSRINSFKAAATYVKDIEEGVIDKTLLDKQLIRVLEASNADPVLLELFGEGYNFNMSNMVDKAEQIVLSHFSSGFNQKVNGTKVSLVSDSGIEVLRNPNGSVIPYHVIKQNPDKYANWPSELRGSLQHNKKYPDGIYSECMLSERVLTKHGLKVGDTIPEFLFKALGYRIPTQDKHSAMAFKIVGLMPNYMEGTGIFPMEIVYLSGADFDIDSEFIQTHGYWLKDGKPVVYGTETDIFDKWNAFLYYMKNTDKLFRSSYDANLFKILSSLEGVVSSEIRKEAESRALDLSLAQFNLPKNIIDFENTKNHTYLNNGVVNNKILDNRIALLTNESMLQSIAYEQSTTKSLELVSQEIDNLKKQNSKYTVSVENTSASDINGKFNDNIENSAGKDGIGIVANKLQVFTFLAKAKVKLSEKAFKYKIGNFIGEGYKYLNSANERVTNMLSTLLSVMTDNAKDPIAGKLGLSIELIPGFSEAISQGLPELEAALLINQPIIQLYSDLKKTKGFAIKSSVEEKWTSEKTIAATLAAYLVGGVSSEAFSDKYNEILESGFKPFKDRITTLTVDDMKKVISGAQKNKVVIDDIQINALMQFVELEKQHDVVSNVSTLLKLNKGLTTSFTELRTTLVKALRELGIGDKFNLKDESDTKDVKEPIIDITDALTNDPLTRNNIINALDVLNIGKKMFVSQTSVFKKSLSQLFDVLGFSYKNKKNTLKEINKSLLGFISNKGYKTLLKGIISDPKTPKRVKDVYAKRLANISPDLIHSELDGKTLAMQLLELKNSKKPSIKNNALVRYLKAEIKEGSDLHLVSALTFVKESREFIVKLVDAYKELYNNPETRDFATNMFNYLIVKDNLEFKNNTFIKYIAPFMFDKLSDSLDGVVSELSKDKFDSKKVLGSIMDEISYNFRKLFVANEAKSYSKKLIYKDLKNHKNGFTINDKNDTITFDLFQKLDKKLLKKRDEYIKEQTAALLEKNEGVILSTDVIDKSFKNFEKLSKAVAENRVTLDQLFPTKLIGGKNVNAFPQFVKFGKDLYELVSFSNLQGEVAHPINKSIHYGTNAKYSLVDSIGSKKVTPFAYDTYEEAKIIDEQLTHYVPAEVKDITDVDFNEDDNSEPSSDDFEDVKPKKTSKKSLDIEDISEPGSEDFKQIKSKSKSNIASKEALDMDELPKKTGNKTGKNKKINNSIPGPVLMAGQDKFEKLYNKTRNSIMSSDLSEGVKSKLVEELDNADTDEALGAVLEKFCML